MMDAPSACLSRALSPCNILKGFSSVPPKGQAIFPFYRDKRLPIKAFKEPFKGTSPGRYILRWSFKGAGRGAGGGCSV